MLFCTIFSLKIDCLLSATFPITPFPKFIFTSGKMHSSTELLNSSFNEFNPAKKIIKNYFKKNKKDQPFNVIFKSALNKIKKE